MSSVWSCNEWDPLEEVIVGNPLNARFPTRGPKHAARRISRPTDGRDPARTVSATDHRRDRRGPERICSTSSKAWASRSGVRTPGRTSAQFSTIHWEVAGLLQLLPARRDAGHRRSDHRNAQCHPQPRAGNVQLSQAADGIYEVGRKLVQRAQAHAAGFALRGLDLDKPTPRNDEPAFDAANVLRFGEDLIYLVSAHRQRDGRAVAAVDPRRQVSRTFLQRRLLRQPYRLDACRAAARPGARKSFACSMTTLCPRS